MTAFEDFNAGDTLLQRFTLISAFSPQVWLASDCICGDKVIIRHAQNQQLQREWACMSQCSSPYILQPLECLYDSSLLILPYINGLSMLAFSQAQSGLFISLIPQIVRALCHLHQQGWVHGDIKPSNILYQPQQALIKVIDFGAAQPLGSSLSDLQQWQLTQGFCRTEKQQGIGIIEAKDDWYALSRWLQQINQKSLTLREQNKLKNWKIWLKEQL